MLGLSTSHDRIQSKRAKPGGSEVPVSMALDAARRSIIRAAFKKSCRDTRPFRYLGINEPQLFRQRFIYCLSETLLNDLRSTPVLKLSHAGSIR